MWAMQGCGLAVRQPATGKNLVSKRRPERIKSRNLALRHVGRGSNSRHRHARENTHQANTTGRRIRDIELSTSKNKR